MNHAKWHKYSSVALLISAFICIYSGHKIVSVNHRQSSRNAVR